MENERKAELKVKSMAETVGEVTVRVEAEFHKVKETGLCPHCGKQLELEHDEELCNDGEMQWRNEYDVLFCSECHEPDGSNCCWAFKIGEKDHDPVPEDFDDSRY